MPAVTQTRFFTTGSLAHPLRLRDGDYLPGVQIAYETWGELNADRSNAIFLFHALSGSHHAAGFNPAIAGVGDLWQEEMHDGWWEAMIGPGKALDTDKYFIICANYLGGCYGSTGPASQNPATGKPWGSAFPAVTAADQVEVFAKSTSHRFDNWVSESSLRKINDRLIELSIIKPADAGARPPFNPVSYTHLTLPTKRIV